MGLTDYIRNKPTTGAKEKDKQQAQNGSQLPLQPQLGTLSGHSSGIVSTVSSTFVDDIKHEVMVNYLFQQQAAMMWGDPRNRNSHHDASGASGPEEGVLLRKSKGCYLGCPSELARGTLADVCTALNVQVRGCRALLWCDRS